MGRGRPGQGDSRGSSRGCRRQAGAHEPPLERSLTGDGPFGNLLEELDSNQARSPGEVLLPQPHRGLDHRRGGGLIGGAVMIIRRDAIDAPATKPLEESTDGGRGQIQ
jgi:hypothetical protein